MSLLEVTNLTQYFGGLRAVNNFNVSLESGELVGLIGPNGAGKTTIFNLVSGFYEPTKGDIRFKGVGTARKKPFGPYMIGGFILGGPLGLGIGWYMAKNSKTKPHQITAMGVARTFQNLRLWNEMTVLDNIRLSYHYFLGYGLLACSLRTPKYMRREKEITTESYEVLEALDLKQYAQEKPKNLPYGLRRRVEIARALTIKPTLLMLDEPAAGLNTADLDGLIQLIRWIHKEYDITIWMIEHQMQVVMSLCERIQVIDFGTTIAEGTPEEIQNNPDVIKAYLGEDKYL